VVTVISTPTPNSWYIGVADTAYIPEDVSIAIADTPDTVWSTCVPTTNRMWRLREVLNSKLTFTWATPRL